MVVVVSQLRYSTRVGGKSPFIIKDTVMRLTCTYVHKCSDLNLHAAGFKFLGHRVVNMQVAVSRKKQRT